MNLQENLTKICKDLMLEQPFYGFLLLNLNKEWSTTKIKTAGVGIEGINFKLYINPDFWSTLTNETRKGLLQHELMHLAFFHLTDYTHLKDHKISNIAKDIEINQGIPPENLPEGGCTLEAFKDKYNLLPNEGTNAYYKKLIEGANQEEDDLLKMLMDAADKGEDEVTDGDGNTVKVPEHNWKDFEKMSEAEQKLAVKQIERILTEVVEQVNKMQGKVPSSVQLRIDNLKKIEPAKFNWKKYLRRFIGESSKSTIRKTKRKQSKRFELDFGIRIQEFSSILIGIDSSQSVSNEEIMEFLNEIKHMYKAGHDFTIIFADTQMQAPFKYKPNIPIEIKQRGGTDFNPIVNYYSQHKKKYTTLIYLTDGECSSPDIKLKNMLWVLSERSNMTTHLPGKTIKLNSIITN